MQSAMKTTALLVAIAQSASAIALDANSPASIKNASATLAANLFSYYHGGDGYGVGLLPQTPVRYYWWEAGAVWGSLIDYASYTNDTTYNPTVLQALQAQVGPNNDYMPPNQTKDIGNDDQSTWALACMDALEYGFETPAANQPSWLELAVNVWNTQAARWNTQSCNGGLKWQIFSFNAGYDYKNSQSNGQFFLLSARLARYTGNSTYADWADKTYDWMSTIGLISSDGSVFDGTDDTTNCSGIDHVEWTANSGSVIYGSAVLYNYTNGSSIWRDRFTPVLQRASTIFFGNSSMKVLTEVACEENTPINCNTDQLAFKSLFTRYVSKATIMAPSIHEQVSSLMTSTATAAAQSCSGGVNQTSCGVSWSADQFGGAESGVGQEMSALSVIQSLLLLNGNVGSTDLRVLRQGDASVGTGGNGTAGNSTTTTGSGSGSNSTTGSGSGAAGSNSSNTTYNGRADALSPSSVMWQAIGIVTMLALGQFFLL